MSGKIPLACGARVYLVHQVTSRGREVLRDLFFGVVRQV